MMANFSNKEDEILINFVRNHEILYDVKHRHYRQAKLKKEIWREVGQILNKTDTECYKRWCCVRDYYIRRRGKTTYGGEALKRRAKLLNFLDKYAWLKRRRTDEEVLKEEAQDNNEMYMIHVTEDAEDPLSDKGDQSIDASYKSNNSEDDVKPFENYNETNVTKNQKWKHREVEQEPTTEHDSSNSYEDCKNVQEYQEPQNTKLKRKQMQAEECLNQILQSTVYKVKRNPSTDSNWDETDLFFSSIAKIVKKLPKYDQIELRMQIGSLVGNAELRCIDKKSLNVISPQLRPSGSDYPDVRSVKQRKTTDANTKYLEIPIND